MNIVVGGICLPLCWNNVLETRSGWRILAVFLCEHFLLLQKSWGGLSAFQVESDKVKVSFYTEYAQSECL